MKTNSTQQEILLVTGTSFLAQEFRQPGNELTYDHLKEKEQLKVACRSGHLPAMLPEVFELRSENRKLYLWLMREGSLFIELKSGEIYQEVDMQSSIDPYSFLPIQILS